MKLPNLTSLDSLPTVIVNEANVESYYEYKNSIRRVLNTITSSKHMKELFYWLYYFLLRFGHHPTKTWGRYVAGLASRSVLSDWLRYCCATRSTSLMQSCLHINPGKYLSPLTFFYFAIFIFIGLDKVEATTTDKNANSSFLSSCYPVIPSHNDNFRLGANEECYVPKVTAGFNRIESSVGINAVNMDEIIYVDESNASGIETGASWATAFTSLQDAIDFHNSINGPIDQIWVAQGNYRPDVGLNYTLNDRNASFSLPSGVQILGGFPNGGGQLIDRDWETYPTRLNGEIGNPGISDNSASIITTQNVSSTTVLDGFIIENGTASVLTFSGQNGGAWVNIVDGSGNSSSPQAINCVFQNNESITNGGAIFNDATNGGRAELTFTDCRFQSNRTTSTVNGFGGAVYNGSATNGVANLILMNCFFEGNSGNVGGTVRSIARDGGTGSASLTVINSLFYQNTATSLSGISVFNLNGTTNINKIINSTFYGNVSTNGVSGGGAIRMDNVSSGSQVINCILWANIANESPGTNQLRLQGGSVSVRNNTIQDYSSSVNGNSSTDPLFVNPANGDFRLMVGSPSIDSGDGTAYLTATGISPSDDNDLNGELRLEGSEIDRGAYEYRIPCPPGNVVFVDASATGFNDGTSWENAYTDLQSAFDNECPGITEIWVAAGTYYPSQNTSNTSAGPLDRNNTFSLRNGLAIYGGFNGTENNRIERDWNTNQTILSGDLDQNDGPGVFENNEFNALAVVTGISIDSTAIIDGFIITGGTAEEASSTSFAPENTDRTGAGMYNYFASPTIMNCSFTGNIASFGGGLLNFDSSPKITNCVFSGNEAFIGGGLSNISNSSPTVTNCVFLGNVARDNAGAINISGSSNPIIINCTVSGNTAERGGGISINNFSTVTVSNCIFWNNAVDPDFSTETTSASIFTQINANTIVENSLIDNSGGSGNWQFNSFTIDGGNNIDMDPLFVLQPPLGLGTSGDLRLQACSPAINSGENALLPVGIGFDLDGNFRFFGGVIDMGAYEFQDVPAEGPTVNCGSIIGSQSTNTGACSYTAIGSEFDPEITGICPIVSTVNDFNAQASLAGSDFPVGETVVIWTVTDERGETSSCSINIVIEDNEDPIAQCLSSYTLQLDINGMSSISTDDIDSGSSDNCGDVLLALSQTDFDCTHLGSNTVTLTVTDLSDNSSQCTAEVIVEDSTDPLAQCTASITLELDGMGEGSIVTDDIDDGSSDNCGDALVVLSQTDFDCTHLGSNIVTLTVTDLSDNSSQCTAEVIVEESIDPLAQCTASITIDLDVVGEASINTDDIDTGSSDNCGDVLFDLSQTDFDCTHLGSNTVTLTVMDLSDNSSQCTAEVIVEDNLNPLAQCTASITIDLDVVGEASINTDDIDNGSSDNCGDILFDLSQTDFDCTHIGSNIVILTVTDLSDNTSQCTAEVIVIDNINPMAQCADDFTIQLDVDGETSIVASDIDAGSTDNCGNITLQLSQENFDCFHIGENTVILTVTDENSNSSQCSSQITVADTISPSIECFDTTVQFNGEETIMLNVNDLANTVDNCGIYSISANPKSVNTSQIGSTIPVVVTVSDNSGNSSTCTSQVFVSGLPPGWSQTSDGVGCSGGSNFEYNPEGQIWTATSTNCYYSAPFTSDQIAFAQRTLCGNGSITAQVIDISGTALGWAGVVMRETNALGAKKAQLMTNRSNFSRREFRTITNGSAHPQQFPTFNRYWLRITRTGNQFIMHVSPNGINWFFAGAQNIVMTTCIEVGLVTTNYSSNSTVTATFTDVSVIESEFNSRNQVAIQAYGTNKTLGQDESSAGFKVYPNPTSNELFIDLKDNIGRNTRMEIYGTNGSIYFIEEVDKLDQQVMRLDMTQYPPGIYLIRVISEGLFEETKRIVVID